MKQRSIALFIVLFGTFLATQGFSQKLSPKSFISLNGGIAAPTGSFTKTDYDNDASGFASTGYHINLSGTYYFKKSRWGIGVLGGYSGYGFHGAQQLANGFKDGFDVDSSTVYRKGNNTSWSLLAGPYYAVPFSSKLTLDLRVLGGYVHSTLAGYQVFLEDGLDNSFEQKKASAGTFGLQAGAGIKYAITQRLALAANVDYFYSKPDFSVENVNRPIAAGRKIEKYNESIAGINGTLGIVFYLCK